MKKCLSIVFGIVLGSVIMLGNVPWIHAQDTDEFTLDEITVTAQKREENQQKVPIAMEVISADDVRMTGKSDLEEILGNLAGVVINKDQDGLRISLRGMSDDSSTYHGQSASMPTVALNMDGVYSNRKDSGSGLFDMERVEVLYGPQSTLYASNSPGGIVNVVTANPKLDTYEVTGTFEYGNYDALHTEGVLNVPLNQEMAIRTAFFTSTHDGYMSNGAIDEDTKSGRFRTLFQPNDTLSFVATGEIVKKTGHFYAVREAFIDQDDVDDPWYTDEDLNQPSESTAKKAYGRMSLDLGSIGSLSLVPSYSVSQGKDVGKDGRGDIAVMGHLSRERAAELRVSSSSDLNMKWILGFNYYKSKDIMDQKTYGAEDDAYTGESQWGAMNEEAKAIFGNVTYPVADTFRITGGYRWSRDHVYVERRESRLGPDNNVSWDYVNYDNKYDDPDYKIGVEYDLSENSMTYADYSTSYRTQGMTSATSGTIATPPPEKLKAYTIGAKNRFLNNKLQLNASAFYYDYKNYFVSENRMTYYGTDLDNPTSDYVEPDPNSYTWGDGTMMGLDLQTTAIITPKDSFVFSASYLKSEWDDLVFRWAYHWATDTRVPPRQSGNIIPVEIYPIEDTNYNGKSMTKSPEWTINANYKHNFDLWNGGALETQVEAVYKSSYRLTWREDEYPLNYQEGYYKINLSTNYISPDGKWTFSAYVRNLTDYAEKQGYADDDVRVGTPKVYGAVLSVKY